MTRAEMRRLQKQEAAQKKKEEKLLEKIQAYMPEKVPAVVRVSGLTEQEVSDRTGIRMEILANWKRETEANLRKAVIIEAQEKLDKAEDYITLCNILTSLKALDGFRYGKAAALYMLQNYNSCIPESEKRNSRKLYDELHEKWGLEFEFDEQDLNKEMGFDTVDWRYEYIGHHIPKAVFDKIYDDSADIQRVITQLAVLWELCEDFGFHKHLGSKTGSKMHKFMEGCREKYDWIENREQGATLCHKMLHEKYGIEVGWSERIDKVIDKFGL